MKTVKYRMVFTIKGSEKDYLEMKKAIESGEFQRSALDDEEVKSIKETI